MRAESSSRLTLELTARPTSQRRKCRSSQRDPLMLPSLIMALENSNASVRSAAALALGKLGDPALLSRSREEWTRNRLTCELRLSRRLGKVGRLVLRKVNSTPYHLTFELSGRRRQDARFGLPKMYRVPPTGHWWHAVGAPLERGVRRRLCCDVHEGYCPAGGCQSSTLLPSGSMTHPNFPYSESSVFSSTSQPSSRSA